jgi:hypothetical protein
MAVLSIPDHARNIAADLILEYIPINQQTTVSCGDSLHNYTNGNMYELVDLVHTYVGLFRHQVDPEVPRVMYEYRIDVDTHNPNDSTMTLTINYMQSRV